MNCSQVQLTISGPLYKVTWQLLKKIAASSSPANTLEALGDSGTMECRDCSELKMPTSAQVKVLHNGIKRHTSYIVKVRMNLNRLGIAKPTKPIYSLNLED
ncbi:unnamed protein product [Cuscuta epithymum]|uniref:Uncharacterized protein n=1 Tax=Cuscuta epithymum TaxID=186058 RepID=A0AAV0G321_9ASTE|nr:unnamed protein product [Cuscuta epithymum]